MKIAGVVAVVTGGASGLGEATARALAKEGVKVAIFDLNSERGEALAKELGGKFYSVNVSDESSVSSGFTESRADLGQERILVNCAGTGNAIKTASISKETGQPTHFPLNDFKRIIDINLIGTFNCIAKSACGMLTLEPLEDGERGVIINTASIAAIDGQAGQAAYAASKAGIVGFTLPIARDLRHSGIRVNTIMPGIFDTPLMSKAPTAVRESLAETVAFPKRLGKPEEYASFVLELCRNTYFNGESIRLDGGIRMGLK